MPRVACWRPRGTGTVYRKGRLWSVSCMESGGRRYAHSFTSKDQAGRTLVGHLEPDAVDTRSLCRAVDQVIQGPTPTGVIETVR